MLRVEFCGESHSVKPESEFTIGREGDLAIDDNEFLHRRFLVLTFRDGYWWLVNTGSHLSVSVADGGGGMEAWLAPGGSMPIVFPETSLRFSAGATTYEVSVSLAAGYGGFSPVVALDPDVRDRATDSQTTIGPPLLTLNQRLVVVALAESALRDGARGAGSIPTSAEAARRLGLKLTAFNRRLDTVCEKLEAAGVRGLHGGSGALAAQRKARLIEYALAARLVTTDDLPLLDLGFSDVDGSGRSG